MNFKLVIYGTLFLFFFSCNEKKECCKTNEPINSQPLPNDESIYNIESKWITQDGQKVKLDTFKGKIVITAMVFTHCESACPRIVSDMQRIEKEIHQNPKVHFLLISMDPERDTPERFKEFAKERKLNSNWTMISSSQEATDEIANVLGVKIKKLSNGGFDHSNSIFVLDSNGNIIFTQDGLEQEPRELILKVNELAN